MMFPNMNMMMNNNIQMQNLINMKVQLTNLESQYNSLITQAQNIGIIPNINILINNISLQFINFAIQLLNIGLLNNNMMNDNYNIKKQIDDVICKLNFISMNINMNQDINMMNIPRINENSIKTNNQEPTYYNVTFQHATWNNSLVVCNRNMTVREMIKIYLIKIGKMEFIDHDEEELSFFYNGRRINNNKKDKSKKVYELFGCNYIPVLKCCINGI